MNNLGIDPNKYTAYFENNANKIGIFSANVDKEVMSKTDSFEKSFSLWIGYYRKFPHVFVEEYLGVKLKDFQILILYQMMDGNYTMFLASRGLGKTFLTAIFVLTMCILYPETKIVVAGGVKAQSMKIVTEKIPEIINRSKTGVLEVGVGKEIRVIRTSMNTDDPNVEFYNGSTIKIVPATENARSARANVLVLDEFRMIDLKIYQGVLRRFLAVQRQPRYLENPEYEHLTERNKEIFLTSAYYKFHWCYDKYKTFYKNMSSKMDSGYNVIAFPYQVAVMAGLVNGDQLIDEMKEDGTDPNLWGMEMNTLFLGESDKAYYKYDKLNECRMLYHPYLPKQIESEIDIKEFSTPPKKPNEIRVISADIALMSGIKNDNSVISLICAYPNKSNQYYIREVRNMEAISGGKPLGYHALRIRQLFNEFDADYIVLDSNGIGMQVYGDLVRDMKDPDTDRIYYGLGCMNDDTMQELVPNQECEKIIFSVKANTEINKQCNSSLQGDIIRRRIRFLTDEQQADDILSHSKKYPNWTTTNEGLSIYNKIINPYKQTTALINEMINLEIVDIESIKLKEKSGKRKDRFSSVAYGNYFIDTLEVKLFTKGDLNWSSYCVSSKSNGYNQRIYA